MNTSFTNPLHLYRSLLRETTYLFDPHVRSYIHGYIAKSFRSAVAKTKSSQGSSNIQHADRLPPADERYYLKRGRKFLSFLHRANQGYITPLNNVIKMAYGRKGKRRRELLAPIMAKDHMTDPETRKNLLAGVKGKGHAPPMETKNQKWVPPAAFYDLLQSQYQVQRLLDLSRKIKTSPEIPLLNNKGLPMPWSRTKNMASEWYHHTAESLLPYLSEKEWNALQERVAGRGFVFPARRTIATTPVFSKASTVAVNLNENIVHLLQGAPKNLSKQQRFNLGNPRTLNVRLLRRIYNREVLQHTPKLVPKGSAKGMNIYWYDGPTRLISAKTLPEGQQTDLLFG